MSKKKKKQRKKQQQHIDVNVNGKSFGLLVGKSKRIDDVKIISQKSRNMMIESIVETSANAIMSTADDDDNHCFDDGSKDSNDDDDDRDDELGGLSRSCYNTSVSFLNELTSRYDLFRSPSMRDLRTVIFQLIQPAPGSYSSRISDALSDNRWCDAMSALTLMRNEGHVPKLGAVQRWVRDVDAAGDDPMALRVLDAVIRTAAPEQISSECMPLPSGASVQDVVRRYPPWAGRPMLKDLVASGMTTDVLDTIEERECALLDTSGRYIVSTEELEHYKEKFTVIAHELGHQRRPINRHDLYIYTNIPNTIPLIDTAERRAAISRIPFPNVPGAFMLCNVFSPLECKSIRAASESAGYIPDEPAARGIRRSILAHAFVWLPDDEFMRILLSRVEPLLPASLCGGRLTGINRRFRCYRYAVGAVYRPHVDGAWPGSGISPEGNYVYDAYGDQWSRLTFLIYLNSGFEGGMTTFFTPSYEEGHLNAHSASPRTGCVLVFPHGDTTGSLVHEGSAVTGGFKYIIRTDVLYSTSTRRSHA